jgi:hypothetical protein
MVSGEIKMTSELRQIVVSALRSIERAEAATYQAPKSREGKKAIAGHFDPVVGWQLKKLALDRNTTVQKLLEEALGDLFEKNHLPRGF